MAYHCPRVTSRARDAFRLTVRFDGERPRFCQWAEGGLREAIFGT